MDYEEALKVANNLLDKYSVEVWTDSVGHVPAKDELARKIAEEIFNSFEFGRKW